MRLASLSVAGAVVLVLALAVWLRPSSSGHTTLPPASRPALEGAGIGRWHRTSSSPINPRQGDVPFGYRSQWLQPWRAYLDTPPATALRNGLGINFNASAPGPIVDATLRLLARSGLRLARIEIGWNSMDYAHPGQLAPGPRITLFRQELLGMKRVGIRPLILLNANSGGPTPSKPLLVRLVRAAPAGSRQIQVDSRTAAQIVPGRTGLDQPELDLQAGTLFTAVRPGGTVLLSKPLDRSLPAGVQPGTILRFAPFSAPQLPSGAPNPQFQATMNGWLAYAGGVARWVKSTLGDDNFDLEIWNELSFGSSFLTPNSYYDPPPGPPVNVIGVMLDRTVHYLRQRDMELSGVGITDGFASETPFASPAISPDGLTALSKHPYHGLTVYPADQATNSIRSLNALGGPDYSGGATFSQNATDRFIPHYSALFPEYFLTALQTETLTRDLAPTTSSIYGVPHGRYVTTPNGGRVELWLTEMGTAVGGADLSTPGGAARSSGLSTADVEHILAKTTLRTYCAFINKGAQRVYMYAAFGTGLGLVDDRFVAAAAGGQTPPASGGPVMDPLARFSSTLSGAQPIAQHRPLELEEVASKSQRVQFEGDGTAAHPALYDRDVLAFLPFQLTEHSWIVPVYVMTRDVARAYGGGTSPTRFDLPQEAFRLEVRGVDASTAEVSLYDPVANRKVPARIIARDGDTVTIQLLVTDSPRMLKITDG